MLTASELAARSFAEVQRLLRQRLKLLITHHSRPAAVLLDWQAFEGLVRRLEELEDLAEEAEMEGLLAARAGEESEEWRGQADLEAALAAHEPERPRRG